MAKAVLVVDDSPDFLELLEELLGREGYTVLKAGAAVEGLEMIARNRPAAVLLDIMMPDRTGVDMLENIRWERGLGELPVFCMSAGRVNGEALRFINSFSQGLLGKSDLNRLVAEVKKTIGPP